MSDCHLGSWSNHPDMRDYSVLAFEKAINRCIEEKVAFVLIAGDMFDTSMPGIDVLKKTAEILSKLKEENIPVYVVPGSHDYSPTGKTMLAVFEKAGILTDVYKYEERDGKIFLKFTVDRRTGTKITGVMGRRGSLEVKQFQNIDKGVENEPGTKIFVFHAGLAEVRPESMKDMLAVRTEDLPKNFSYYASGHVHKQYFDAERNIAFPGELFPTSFDEMEGYSGSFLVADVEDGKVRKVEKRDARLFGVVNISIDVTGKSSTVVENEILRRIADKDFSGNILLLKLSGVIEAGRISDINFNEITVKALENGAIIVKRSTSGVSVKEFEEARIIGSLPVEQLEKGMIEKHAEQLNFPGIADVEDFVLSIMAALAIEKHEDETNATFEERLLSGVKKVVKL